MGWIGTWLFIKLACKQVGGDKHGNKYFVSRCKTSAGLPKRLVWYKGLPEPSKVPPEWHGWLHYENEVPVGIEQYVWQADRVPNLTGTKGAYKPTSASSITARSRFNSYQAWNEES
jgi:NADH:ubiquinone oxidoreductase subunit